MSARALLAVAALSTVPARAEGPSLRWSYARGTGAERCPDAEALREAMAAQLGRDPFTEPPAPAGSSLRAEVERVRGGLRARLELHDGAGQLVGVRELYGGDCGELSAALTLAGAMAVDALATTAAPSPPVGRVTQADDDEVPGGRPGPPPRAPTRLQVTAGLAAALDATTLIAAALIAGIDIIRPNFSAGIELRGDLPSSQQVGAARVSGSLWSGALVPCWRYKVAALCGIIAVGNERVEVVPASPQVPSLSAVWAAMGGRIALELPIERRVALRLHADVTAPLVRHEITSSATLLYRTPSVSSSLGLAVAALFP